MCRGVLACPGDERIVATVTEGDEMSRVSQPVLEFLPVEACSVGASAGWLILSRVRLGGGACCLWA